MITTAANELVRLLAQTGAGDRLAFRQLYEKLEGRGWFSDEHKKPIPSFPKRLGLVTSQTGAALQDMLRILRDRWSLTEIWLIPVPVQGEQAAGKIAETITWLNTLDPQPDLLIVARVGSLFFSLQT